MFDMTDVIVALWFLPVALCILIPLLMLCGYAVLKLFGQSKTRRKISKEKDRLEDAAVQTEGSR